MIFYLEEENSFVIINQTTLRDGDIFILAEDITGNYFQVLPVRIEPANYGPYVYIGEL